MKLVRYFTVLLFVAICSKAIKYTPDWKSIDSRPLPGWFDESKFGIFIVWGLYSVPSFGSEWFWYNWKSGRSAAIAKFMEKNYKPGFTYPDFGPQFTTEFFDPDKIAEIVKSSGAKYVVLTSKHHDGYTLWPSNYSWNWNSVDLGPHRDLVGELKEAIVKVGVHFGLYFSQFEWFNNLFIGDKEKNFTTQAYVKARSIPEMKELVHLYHPDVIWSDGAWDATSAYWNSTEFLAWLYNESPVRNTVVVNDRWGSDASCKHGGFYTCHDKYDPGKLIPHKWENCMTVDKTSWGFRRTMNLASVCSIEFLIEKLARAISCGGNLLLNVGPTHDGRIVPIFEERLRQMGTFLGVNGEAVYGTKPWIFQNDTTTPNIWYTSRLRNDVGLSSYRLYNFQSRDNTVVYAFLLNWPKNNKLVLGSAHPTGKTKVSMLGYRGGTVHFVLHPNQITIDLSAIRWNFLPTYWAWVFKLEYLQSSETTPNFAVYATTNPPEQENYMNI